MVYGFIGAVYESSMRILLTNDDGINAEGLEVLYETACTLSECADDIWIVAPASEKSGVGHCISLASPVLLNEISERRFSVEGNPADCVLVALHHIMVKNPPDLILSGVNRGNNSAENALYSGTLGAAMEGAIQGIPSFALSQYFGPNNRELADPFAASRAHASSVIRQVLDRDCADANPYRLFYNVNFPPCPAESVKGMQFTKQGMRRDCNFGVTPILSPSRREFFFVTGGDQQIPTDDGTDAAANLSNFISVTPMRADLTDHSVLQELKART